MSNTLRISNQYPYAIKIAGTEIKTGEAADIVLKNKSRYLNLPYMPYAGFYTLGEKKISGFSKKKFGFLIRYDSKNIELRSTIKNGNIISVTVNEFGQLELSADCDMEEIYLPSLSCEYASN